MLSLADADKKKLANEDIHSTFSKKCYYSFFLSEFYIIIGTENGKNASLVFALSDFALHSAVYMSKAKSLLSTAT